MVCGRAAGTGSTSRRRFVSLDSATHLAEEVGRSESAQSEAVGYVMEHLVARFPYLFDHRSFFACWEARAVCRAHAWWWSVVVVRPTMCLCL